MSNIYILILLLICLFLFVFFSTNRLVKKIKRNQLEDSSKLTKLVNEAMSTKLRVFCAKYWFYRAMLVCLGISVINIAIKLFVLNKTIELKEEVWLFFSILIFLSLVTIYQSIMIWIYANKYQKR